MLKLEKIPAWQLTKVRNKKEVINEARTEGGQGWGPQGVRVQNLRVCKHPRTLGVESDSTKTMLRLER